MVQIPGLPAPLRVAAPVLCAALSLLALTALPAGPVLAESAIPAPVACNDQAPQSFLIRGNYVFRAAATLDERRARADLHRRAIRYRTERYGRVKGSGVPEWNPSSPVAYAETTTFVGIPILVNRRITPALRCAEQQIQSTCPGSYRPAYLSGMRRDNTFHDGEISNHTYGIAVDVDPEHNVCCHCVGPGREHPICKREASVSERMAMPLCWVTAFERYGFYWLGRDELEDTMHFEFLGDPDRIVRGPRETTRAQ